MKTRSFATAATLLFLLLGSGRLPAAGSRATEPVTIGNRAMSLTIAPDASVSMNRGDTGKVVSNAKSGAWSIMNWISGTRITLDNMAKVGPNELRLWSSKGPFEVKVAITAKDRYFKFELLHVSNEPQTGGLNDDWPGHRVEFAINTSKQDDGWKLNTIRLNPMSELKGRWNYKIDDGVYFSWPYPQWAQTTDRPQPQGAVGVFGFTDDKQHDDILTEIWVAEPSLPRPNRANLKSWTKADVEAWVDRCEAFYGTPWRTLSFQPTVTTQNKRGWKVAPGSLYTAADLAAKAGLNSIYLSQHYWQGDNIGDFDRSLFPGGREQAIAWRKHCDSLGIHLQFHGFSHLILKPDPNYGWGVVHEDLAKSARGKLLHDVPADAKGRTILVDPDLDYMPGMKKGMLPFYNINDLPEPRDYNGAVGGTFPPYYEGMASLISLNRNLYPYQVSLTPDHKWKIVIGDGPRALRSKTPLVEHKAGDTVEFVLTNANGNYFLPDSRSELLVKQAIGYARLLNDMQTTDGYDGSAWTEDLGSWGLRKFSQEVYERMDHPGGGGSAIGIMLFGHFEQQFKRVQKAVNGKGSNIPVYLADDVALAPSMDDAHMGACKGVNGKDIGLRAVHGGLTLEIIEHYGLWEQAGALLTRWSQIKPRLSAKQRQMISDSREDFYVASETADEWEITKARVMRREGIDGSWNTQPERPLVSPRQFFRADGTALNRLLNPFAAQTPVIELNVMATMSADHAENVSLMPAKADDIVNPAKAVQTLAFESGRLKLELDNSTSAKPYEYMARNDTVGHWPHKIDMSRTRGVVITVKGDGSGSTLVLASAAGGFPRMYAVDINFVGERTIEIPNGEVANHREGWNIFAAGTITQFDYAGVDRFRLFLHKVPAGRKANIEILDIRAMKEDRTTGLIDPVLALGGTKAAVKGTIPYNHYLVYAGGSSVKVYGPNWKFVNDLPVTAAGDLKAVKGNNMFSVSAPQSPNAWLSSRIKVEDTAKKITIQKPKSAR